MCFCPWAEQHRQLRAESNRIFRFFLLNMFFFLIPSDPNPHSVTHNDPEKHSPCAFSSLTPHLLILRFHCPLPEMMAVITWLFIQVSLQPKYPVFQTNFYQVEVISQINVKLMSQSSTICSQNFMQHLANSFKKGFHLIKWSERVTAMSSDMQGLV